MLQYGRFGWKETEEDSEMLVNQSRRLTQSIVSEWASILKEIGEISMSDLNRSWDAVLKGHCRTKVVHKVEWQSPLPFVPVIYSKGLFHQLDEAFFII